jgi:hypothetical protein
MNDVRTMAGLKTDATATHTRFLRMTILTLERTRRERVSMRLQEIVDQARARMVAIDAEIEAILGAAGRPGRGGPPSARTAPVDSTAAVERQASEGGDSFRFKY